MNESNMYLIMYIAAWSISLAVYTRKKRIYGAGNFIISTYLLYAICSFLLYNNELSSYKPLTFFPFLFLFAMLLISLQPVLRFNEKSKIQSPSPLFIKSFAWFYLILTIIIIPFVISGISEGISAILLSSTGGDELYYQSHLQAVREARHPLFVIISNLFHVFSDFSILVFFFSLTLKDKNKNITIGLGIAVLITILESISIGGRTIAAMKILLIFSTYFLLRKNIDNKIRKKIHAISVLLIALIAILVFSITTSRFTGSEGGSLYSVESYVGQANIYFNNYGLDAGGIRNGDRTCNTFKKILGLSTTRDIDDTRNKYANMMMDDSVFYTFVGDFSLDFGPIITSIIIILSSIIACSILKPNKYKKILFHQLIVVYIFLAICSQGGMYLFYYSYTGNYNIIAYILLAFLAKWDYETHVRKSVFTTK